MFPYGLSSFRLLFGGGRKVDTNRHLRLTDQLEQFIPKVILPTGCTFSIFLAPTDRLVQASNWVNFRLKKTYVTLQETIKS